MLDRDQQQHLRQAYASAPDCPLPELFLRASFDALPADERQRVEEHMAGCPRCAAERTLAQDFDEAAIEDPGARADVDFIIARLSNPARSGERAAADVTPFPARRARVFRWSPALAAAATVALVIVGSVAVWRSTAPQLPEAPGTGVVRGSRLELVAPLGDIAERPDAFEWVAVSGAARYRVQLFEVDDSVLFETTTGGNVVDLPQDVAGKLSAAVVYVWQVEAQDVDGKRLAWSKAMRFRVRPRAED